MFCPNKLLIKVKNSTITESNNLEMRRLTTGCKLQKKKRTISVHPVQIHRWQTFKKIPTKTSTFLKSAEFNTRHSIFLQVMFFWSAINTHPISKYLLIRM